MTAPSRRGFTIAEVLVAVVMLTVGVMALVGSSATVTRMVGRGRISTFAGQASASRVEAALWKSDSVVTGATTEKWEILDNADNSRRVRVTMRYPVARGVANDTVITRILCK